jgi:hypothetical protein
MKIKIKKTIVVLLAVLLATTLCVSMASAKTADNNLPSKSEIQNYAKGYTGSDFVNRFSSATVANHPSWTWDKWQDGNGNKYISYYYKSGKGHGSIYFNDEGKVVKPEKWELMESWQGIP